MIHYSIVIPAYNEAERLPRSLPGTVEFFRSLGEPFEILVVDDGSRDATASWVEEFRKSNPEVRLLSYGGNRGKGFAVKTGALAASGNLVLFCDADGSTPIAEFLRLKQAIDGGAAVAIGSRALASNDTTVSTNLMRKLIGRCFNTIANIVVIPGIADTQCGFKLFTRDSARYLFERQTSERFSFDVEILFLAHRAGFTIAEIPVNWTNVEGSKVNFVSDSLQMFCDMFRFRWNALCGRYR